MTAAVVVAVIGVGAGLWLVVTGWRPDPEPVDTAGSTPVPTSVPVAGPTVRDRALRAAAAGTVVLVVSRWPVAAVAGALVAWFTPELFAPRSGRDAALARTEAIATWTEMLRDTISAAHGLEAAIMTTAPVAPRRSVPRSNTSHAPGNDRRSPSRCVSSRSISPTRSRIWSWRR